MVSVLIDGMWIDVTTEAGESSVIMAQKVANAINGNLTLSLLYPTLVAGASGAQLYVTGMLSQVVITDRGLLPFLFEDGFESGDTTAWSSSVR